MAPKETAYLTQLNPFKSDKNLLWTFYENAGPKLSLLTKNFSIKDKLDQLKQEKFAQDGHDK